MHLHAKRCKCIDLTVSCRAISFRALQRAPLHQRPAAMEVPPATLRDLRARTMSAGKGEGNAKETSMGVLDDYLIDNRLSLLDKTKIQAQVLVPVMQALRAELGKDKADAIV